MKSNAMGIMTDRPAYMTDLMEENAKKEEILKEWVMVPAEKV